MFDNDYDDYLADLTDDYDDECGPWCVESCIWCEGEWTESETIHHEPSADSLLMD